MFIFRGRHEDGEGVVWNVLILVPRGESLGVNCCENNSTKIFQAQFGCAPGVVRTRVGFTGGTKIQPTYRSIIVKIIR